MQPVRLNEKKVAAAPAKTVGAAPAALLATILAILLTAPTMAGASCADTAAADLVITGARIAVTGAGTGSDTTTIHISGDRICAIGTKPAHAESGIILDVRGLTVLPGLIDAHVHLFPMGPSAGIDNDADLERFVRDELPERLNEYLEQGVTTIFSVGDAWPAIRDLRQRLANDEITGPRLLMTGPILTAPGGYPAATICADSAWCRSRLTVELRDEAHARRTVRELAAEDVDAIKIVYDDARANKLDAGLVRVITGEAHASGLPVIAHATSIGDALEVTELGADVLAHLPSGGVVDQAIANRLRQSDIVIITTAGVYAPVDGPDDIQRTVFGLRYGAPFNRFYAQGLANAGVLMEYGVPLAFGSGTAMFTPSQSLAGERTALSMVPLTPSQLLDTMTIHAARALGRESDLGSIDAGKLADLVIVATKTNANADADADADADAAAFGAVVMVIKSGRIVVDRRSIK